MSNKESQKDELCVLESIYNEDEIQTYEENGLFGGQFYAHVDLPADFKIIFRDLRKEDASLEELPLKYLPPLSLRFSLPCDYPSHSSPTYTLSCQWLQNNKLMLLCKKLEEIWKENEGMEVLFLWTQFLKEDSLKFLKITDILDVSSLETSYKEYEEFQQAMKACHLEEKEEEKSEDSEDTKVNVPSKPSNSPTTCASVAQYPRRKQRGRSGWGRKDRVVDQHSEGDRVFEIKTEKCALKETETMTANSQNTGTVRSNSCNSVSFLNSNNQGGGNWAHRKYYRRNYGKGCSYYNRSAGRGNNHKFYYRGASSHSNDQIVLNSQASFQDNEGHRISSKCDNLVGHQCKNMSEAVNRRCASLDCVAETQTKDTEVTLNGVTELTTSNSADVRKKHESESAMSIVNGGRISNVPTRPRMSVIQLLKEYSEARHRTEFSRNFYSCKICFQDKQGSQCTCFEGCGHVFCKSCVAEYFEVRIKDGSVKNICCPEENCTSEAAPSQVRELVSAELFSRYDSVLLSALLDTMEDVLYCPRPVCQYPVALEPGEKMATCPSCGYAFCIYCKMVYHGIEPCRFRSNEKRHLVEEYCSASEERRLQMEQRYGKKQLQALVDTSLSETWLFNNSKKCPSCSAAIEKSDGCNKMVCGKCSTFFCWLCEECLNPQAPYQHFSNPASKCYNLLFHGVPNLDVDDDDDDDWWNAAGIFVQNADYDDDDDNEDEDND